MSDNQPTSSSCPIARMMDITGDRWSFLILRDLFSGVRRFDAIQKSLGISKKVLSQRLGRLTQAGILDRVQYQARPQRFEYRLTTSGRELFPLLVSMQQWSHRWLFNEGEPATELIHTCGNPLALTQHCSHCNDLVTPARVRARSSVKREQ